MLIGSKITLRTWNEEDIPFLVALRNNFQVQTELMAHPKGNSPEQIRDWLRVRTKSDNSLFFIVAEIITNEPIGYIQITDIPLGCSYGKLGICIDPQHQNKGYGNEALIAIEKYAIDLICLRKIELEVLARNKSAIRLYEKLGYTLVGHLREHFYFGKEYLDVCIMEKILSI